MLTKTTQIRAGDTKLLANTAKPSPYPQAFAPTSSVQRTALTAREAELYMRGNQTVPMVLQPSELFSAHMGSYDSIYAQNSFKYAQYNPDKLLGSKGYQVLDEMLTMAACRGPFNLKRFMVLGNPGRVESFIEDPDDPNYSKAQELAGFCAFAIDNIVDVGDLQQDFRQVLFQVLRAAWDGFSVTDIIYRQIETGSYTGKIGYSYFANKPAKEIGFDLDLQTLAVRNIMPYTLLNSYEGPRPLESVLLYVHAPQDGLPYGSGDGRACYKHWFSLDHMLRFWNVAIERWGSPIMVLKYPAGDPAALESARAVTDNIRQGGASIFPDNVAYEVVKIDSGALEGFKRAADWHTEQIALNILGNTLTTGEGERSGSMALGKVHQGTQNGFTGFLGDDLESIVRLQLFRRLIRYNYGTEYEWLAPYFRLSPPTPVGGEDILELAQAFNLLVGMGNMTATSKAIRTIMGLPAIDPDEEKELDQQALDMKVSQQVQSLQGNGSDPQGQQALSGIARVDGKKGQRATSKRRVGKIPQGDSGD